MIPFRWMQRILNRSRPEINESHQPGKAEMYKKIFLYVSIPLVTLQGLFVAWEKRKPEKKQSFVPYEYLRIRRRPFPWGDGTKTLFHNKERNALPDGYEI